MLRNNTIKAKKRIIHFIIALIFFVLFFSGLILFTPLLSILAADSWSRVIHRIFAFLLISIIILYTIINRKKTIGWLKSLLLGEKSVADNPDKWKRKHKALVTIGLFVLIITGSIQWFLKYVIPDEIFIVSLIIHDIAFFYVFVVLLLHLYHEFNWWLWKKRYCQQCIYANCSHICPTNSISIEQGEKIIRDNTCNNCRLCMKTCQKNLYYIKGGKYS
jgi:ferredoxin